MANIIIPGQERAPLGGKVDADAARRILVPGEDGFSPVEGDAEYHPSDIVGACTKCNMVGTLDFPKGYNFFKAADKVMDRKVIRAFCPKCQETTEFKPAPDKDISGYPGLTFLNKAEKKRLREKGFIID